MSRYRSTLVIFTTALLVSGCAQLSPQQKKTESLPRTPAFDTTATTTPATPALWPSLAALAERTFNGHDLKVGRILANNDSYTRYYITYKSDDLTISGIMNVPKGEGPFPVLILNHGHIDTKIYTNGRGLKREQDYLAKNGYVVVHPDYRNHAESDDDPDYELDFRFGYTEDVINLVFALRSSGLPYLDASRVGMLGHSMGGGITENVLVVKPDLIKAAVLFAPVSAVVQDNFNKWTRSRSEVATQLIEKYGEPDTNPAFWEGLSPVHRIDTITAPIMIHHGTADKDVPIEWSDAFVQELTNAGKVVTYDTYRGEPHEFIQAWPTVMERTLEFFDVYVKNPPS